MEEMGHALFLAIALCIAKGKASAGGNLAIERKEEKMFAIFRNVNKGRRHYRINKLARTHTALTRYRSQISWFSLKKSCTCVTKHFRVSTVWSRDT